jgi:hypothetical protein
MNPEYEERSAASILRVKGQALRMLALYLLAGGAVLTLALLAGATDLAEEGAIVVEFRNLGAADSAAGLEIITDDGAYTFLISRDGYLSVSATTPDWHDFPHIAAQHNQLLLTAGENGRTAILYVNRERAWQGEIGVVRGCSVVALGAAQVEWHTTQNCTEATEAQESAN